MSAAAPLAFPGSPGPARRAEHEADSRSAKPVPLSVIIPTLNEGAQIAAAVADLSWADEVIVVDGGSTDNTVVLAQANGARTIVLTGETIAAQRNAGIEAARNQWILALDADERVSVQLPHRARAGRGRHEIPTHAAYRMKFRNHYLGRELALRSVGARLARATVHSRPPLRLSPRARTPRADRRRGHVDGPRHSPPVCDLAHHVAKIVKYARWGADDLYSRGRRAGCGK